MAVVYDHIIVGAGIEGSSTGYYITSNTRNKVLLLEQFDALHTRGSSHGGSRMAHDVYHEPHYVKLMKPCYQMWRDIERASGKELYVECGVLSFGEANMIRDYCSLLSQNGVEYEILTATEINTIYSKQLKLPSDYLVVRSKNGGLVRAALSVATLQQLFVKCGGTLMDRCKVTQIIPGKIVQVQTTNGIFRAKKVIVTAGAWTKKLLEQSTNLTLPLRPIRTEALYWSTELAEDFSSARFPTFLCLTKSNYFDFYGLPCDEYPGKLRIAYHFGDELPDPEARDRIPHNEKTRQSVSKYIQKHFKGVDDKPSIIETCMYTATPDLHPFIDVHPLYSNMAIGAGFSGKGFKFGPIVGKILYELLEGIPTSVDVSAYSIQRFNKQPKL